MARKSIEQVQREAKTNDTVKLNENASRHNYSSRYFNRIGMVLRKTTNKNTNTKVCMVQFPNRLSPLAVDSNDLVVIRVN